MTLDELNEHRHRIRRLRTAQDLLSALRGSSLRAAAPDGMPRAPSNADRVAALAVKCAEQDAVVRRCARLVRESEPPVRAFVDTIEDNRTNLIFYLRFLCGEDWQEVADTIGGGNSPDAVKAVCYRYLRERGL